MSLQPKLQKEIIRFLKDIADERNWSEEICVCLGREYHTWEGLEHPAKIAKELIKKLEGD